MAGRFGTGETNDRGTRLLEFARSHKLTLTNTLFPHKLSRRVTWHSADGRTHNQIDFILMPLRYKSSINKAKTRSFPGADIGSDHDLVLCTFKLKLQAKYTNKKCHLKFDVDKLKDPNVADIFEAQVGGKFAALNLIDVDIDTLSNSINHVLRTTAEEVIGHKQKNSQPWVTNDVVKLCDERRELKKRKHVDAEGKKLYQQANAKVRKKMTEAKEAWVDEQCHKIDSGIQIGDSKAAYNTLKVLTKHKLPKVNHIEDNVGTLLTNKDEVMKRWTDYCSGLYNIELKTDESVIQTKVGNLEHDTPDILKEEVESAIHTLSSRKSPGIDNVPSELLKHSGNHIIKPLTTLCQRIMDEKTWPKEWTQSLVIPLPKKGNLKQCKNYRTISLISHPSKVMLRILLNRLKKKSEEILSEEQAGFRSNRSTVQQIFNSRILTEKYLQHQQLLFHNFIDFKKAFDRVWHDGLWSVMRNYNFDEGIIQTIEALYQNSSSAVLLDGSVGQVFNTTVGVRQGCILSPTLFNIFLEQIMQETLHNHSSSVSIGGYPLCNLRFADDIDLMAGSEQELQNLTDRLTGTAAKYGMEINTEKSEVLVNTYDKDIVARIVVGGEKLQEVSSFKYLGVILTKDGTSTKEILVRLGMATSAMTRLQTVWKSRISFSTKIRLYKSLILSILLYGCEAWTLMATTEKRLKAFENKCYRKMLRVSYTEHRTNEDVLEEVEARAGRQEPLLATAKRRKLAWFGHMVRHDSLCKTVLQGTVMGKRRRGRQRKCWLDNIKEWTGLELESLLEKANNREEWRHVTKSASRTSPRRSTGHGNE